MKPVKQMINRNNKSRLSGNLYIVTVLLLLLLYCKYSHPLTRFIDAGKWWRGFVICIFEDNDVPSLAQYGKIDLSRGNSETGIFSEGVISYIDNDSTIQINSSADSFPNGYMEIPCRKNKVIYSKDSTLLPMYWSAPCPAWIEISWKENQVIDRIEITPNSDEYGMGEYCVFIWDQNLNHYILIDSYSGRAGKFKAITLNSATTSRIRININKGGYGNSDAYLKDLKIFGSHIKD